MSQGGVTVAASIFGGIEFNDASVMDMRDVSANFATSGSKSVDVDFDVTGEGLANEAVNAVTVTATANVWQAASLTTNHASPLGDNASITVANADTTDGGQRAAAAIVSRDVTGAGWSVTGLDMFTTIDQNDTASGTASFDAAASGLLNGATAVGTLQLGFQHANQSIQGTSANDLGTTTWNLETIVTGNDSGIGQAAIVAAATFAGLGVDSAGGSASLLGGTAGDSRTVEMALAPSPVGLGVSVNDAAIGEYLKLSGTGGDVFVLAMSYSGTPDTAFIQWWNGSSWVNAIDGNSVTGGTFFADTAYDEAAHFALGNYGFDSNTNTAWAVLDHNSDFVVVPEPATFAALFGLLALGLAFYRRRMRQQAWGLVE